MLSGAKKKKNEAPAGSKMFEIGYFHSSHLTLNPVFPKKKFLTTTVS